MRIVSVGEILWDVMEDAEHLGGACFNFAAHASQLGHEVVFVSAVGDDERGREALRRVAELGMVTDCIATVPDAATGHVSVTVASDGQPSFVIHRPAAYDFAALDELALGRLAFWKPDWICYGTLHQMAPAAKALRARVSEACPEARRFYDVNLRLDSYTPELVEELLTSADVVKLNDDEVLELGRLLLLPSGSPEEFCRENRERFGWTAVCVTQGAAGSVLMIGDEFVSSPGYTVTVADTVGSGDAFAAAFLHGIGAGWPAVRVADFANRVGALVASRAGAIPRWSIRDLEGIGAGS